MDLLAYWRWDIYSADLDEGLAFHFNSNQPRFHQAIQPGESLWLVTGKPSRAGAGQTYPLLARLVVSAKTHNEYGYKYGRFRLWGDARRSRYFSSDGPDAGALLRQLQFQGNKPITTPVIAQALQAVRELAPQDIALLEAWASHLGIEPRARQIAEERMLERAMGQGDLPLAEVLHLHAGVSQRKREYLATGYARNRELVERLRALYQGHCQLCGQDPGDGYGVKICEAHHIQYLSRGGPDRLENMLLLCPNHHELIHATEAAFDHLGLRIRFSHDREERLALNEHLRDARPG